MTAVLGTDHYLTPNALRETIPFIESFLGANPRRGIIYPSGEDPRILIVSESLQKISDSMNRFLQSTPREGENSQSKWSYELSCKKFEQKKKKEKPLECVGIALNYSGKLDFSTLKKQLTIIDKNRMNQTCLKTGSLKKARPILEKFFQNNGALATFSKYLKSANSPAKNPKWKGKLDYSTIVYQIPKTTTQKDLESLFKKFPIRSWEFKVNRLESKEKKMSSWALGISYKGEKSFKEFIGDYEEDQLLKRKLKQD